MQLVLPSISVLRRLSGASRSRRECRSLPARTTLSLNSPGETVIRCLKGRVWITDGRTDDVVLSSCGKYLGEGGGKIVVEALEDSLVELFR